MKTDVNMMARLAFAAALLAALAGVVVWYVFAASHYATYQIYTRDSVSGLITDAPIEFHGVEVGKVKSVRLVNPRSVAIVLSIDKTVPVTSTSVATITSRGLATRGFTGYVYVALEDVGVGSRPLTTPPGEPYPIIPTAPSKIVTLDTSINQVNQNLQALTERLESLLDEKTIAALKQSADSLQQASQVLADNSQKMNAIIANTERSSHRLEPLLMSSQDTLRALQTQILPEAHQALSNLDQLSRSIGALTTKVNRDPSLLIRGTAPPSPGPGERQ